MVKEKKKRNQAKWLQLSLEWINTWIPSWQHWGVMTILSGIDYLAIILAEYAAFLIRNIIVVDSPFTIQPVYTFLFIPFVFITFLYISKLYTQKIMFAQVLERVFRACVGGICIAIILIFFSKASSDVSRLYVALFAVFVFIFLVMGKFIANICIKRFSWLQIPVLVVGAGLSADALVREIHRNGGFNYKIVGFLEDNAPATPLLGQYPVLGGFKNLERVIKLVHIKMVIIAAPGIEQKQLAELIYRAQSCIPDVGVIPNLVDVPMANVEVESFFDKKIMLIHIKNNLASRVNQYIKRMCDIILASVGIIALSLPLLYIAYKIRRDSPGPILHSGKRIGKNGKLFKCYKFRSMYVNGDVILKKYLAEHPDRQIEWDTYRKLRGGDPRVTPFGETLRNKSLDELPQLFNVLKGDMSLVGPRPYLPTEMPMMGEQKNVILQAKPGITGYWQVSGRNDVTFKQRLDMESWYVYNWSFWIDIVLLFKTVGVVLGKKGAY